MTRRMAALRNLGPVSRRWLAEAGIETEAELRALGAVAAWQRVKFMFGRQVSLNLLYALEATIAGCDWRALPPETKARLQAEAGGAPLRSTRPRRRR